MLFRIVSKPLSSSFDHVCWNMCQTTWRESRADAAVVGPVQRDFGDCEYWKFGRLCRAVVLGCRFVVAVPL